MKGPVLGARLAYGALGGGALCLAVLHLTQSWFLAIGAAVVLGMTNPIGVWIWKGE